MLHLTGFQLLDYISNTMFCDLYGACDFRIRHDHVFRYKYEEGRKNGRSRSFNGRSVLTNSKLIRWISSQQIEKRLSSSKEQRYTKQICTKQLYWAWFQRNHWKLLKINQTHTKPKTLFSSLKFVINLEIIIMSIDFWNNREIEFTMCR